MRYQARQTERVLSPMQQWVNTTLFDLKNPRGLYFNLAIMELIVISVLIAMWGTVQTIPEETRSLIAIFEVIITALFAVEYILRVYAARQPLGYAFSFYGMVDLLTWLPLIFLGDTYLAIRLLRILRLLKLIRYLRAIRLFFASMADIIELVFVILATICIIVLVTGNLMHYIEPETFPNAFLGCWWSIVTMSTVGYGDVVPVTYVGKVLAAITMLTGVTMFALLTGTISIKLSEMVHQKGVCALCRKYIPEDSAFCPYCGEEHVPGEHGATPSRRIDTPSG